MQAWVQHQSSHERLEASLPLRRRGRPGAGVDGKLAKAHRMKFHEGYDSASGAPIVYANEIEASSISREEARIRYNSAASKGRTYCIECGIKSHS